MAKSIHLPCKNKPLHTAECSECSQLEHRVEMVEDKLDTIQEGAEVNVQSDWNETDPTSDSYIQNKPNIDVGYSCEGGEVTTTECFNDAVCHAINEEGCGGGESGYTCEETFDELTDETVAVTTSVSGMYIGSLVYDQLIDADSVVITFDGVEYECDAQVDDMGDAYAYGAPFNGGGADFTDIPFVIVSSIGQNVVASNASGTYSIKIEAVDTETTTTRCFRSAVKSVIKESAVDETMLVRCEHITIPVGTNVTVESVTINVPPDIKQEGGETYEYGIEVISVYAQKLISGTYDYECVMVDWKQNGKTITASIAEALEAGDNPIYVYIHYHLIWVRVQPT